eukprot:2997683-Amphidinium_carterae.2
MSQCHNRVNDEHGTLCIAYSYPDDMSRCELPLSTAVKALLPDLAVHGHRSGEVFDPHMVVLGRQEKWTTCTDTRSCRRYHNGPLADVRGASMVNAQWLDDWKDLA